MHARWIASSATLLLVLGCGISTEGTDPGRASAEADYPVYESLDSLVPSDFIGVVRIGRILSHEMDDGGAGEAESGVPMTFWDGTVVDDFGAVDGLEDIVVGWPDLEKLSVDGRSQLEEGDVVVLFATELTPKDAPGIHTQSRFYVPRGGDNGVLDVVGDVATARSPALRSVRAQDPDPSDKPLAVEIDVIRQLVTSRR